MNSTKFNAFFLTKWDTHLDLDDKSRAVKTTFSIKTKFFRPQKEFIEIIQMK